MVSWDERRNADPDGRVPSRNTGVDRPYGENPCVAYDDPNGIPFRFDGPTDGRLPAMERVLALELDGDA